MNKKILQELDYYTIRESIASFCVSKEGSNYIKTLEPLTDSKKIEHKKKIGREWTNYILSKKTQILTNWHEILPLFSIIQTENAALSQEQAYDLKTFCTVVHNIRKTFCSSDSEIKLPALTEQAAVLADFSEPIKTISRIIDKDGNIKDLPELQTIRKKISSLHVEIDHMIRSYTSNQSLNAVLESSVPVLRSNRQVLAVHSNMKNRIKGIIHDVSQTGQTVYIEPDDVVLKNNELVQEKFHLEAETKRILKDLTTALRPYIDFFKQSLPVMQLLDGTRAAAVWGIQHKSVYPLFSTEDPPLIIKARHPLFGKRAVPVDIRFMHGKRILIITGPNTGGKTATLKTIALFILLNQSGFPIPADEGSRLPVFDNIFADIGDDQSLDESISTFSGHMKNIAYALKHADKNSLILLDELGSGTDPQEGGAIGMSVLDAFLEKGSFVLVTTHHGILKNYGYTHSDCVNASVEFNTDTLSPTYHLLMGVPGESHALEIAKKNGLDDSVVSKAKDYINGEQADVSELIKGLTVKHTELDQLVHEYIIRKEKIKARELNTNLKELRIRQKDLELKKEHQRSAGKFVNESRKKLENLVRELREGEINREKTKKVKSFISQLEKDSEKESQNLKETENQYLHDKEETEKLVEQELKRKGPRKSNKLNKKHRIKNADAFAAAQPLSLKPSMQKTKEQPLLTFTEGATVFVGSSRMTGTLIRQEKKGVWNVQIGSIKMTVKQKDLTLAVPSNKPLTASVTIDLVKETSEDGSVVKHDAKPQFCLRLLGLHYDEALKELEHQLDLCTITNLHSFCIIHGKGTGVLQQEVQDYLSHYPGVAEYHFAAPEDGGTGKTWVTMK